MKLLSDYLDAAIMLCIERYTPPLPRASDPAMGMEVIYEMAQEGLLIFEVHLKGDEFEGISIETNEDADFDAGFQRIMGYRMH
jgi:hypothetical protein